MNALLIAGTDAAVGKTVVATALAAYWQTYCAGRSLGIYKPIDTDGRDRDHYLRLFALNQSPQELSPVCTKTTGDQLPMGDRTTPTIPLDLLWQQFEALTQQRDWVLLEGLGGLGTPITHETILADLAWDWRVPTLLVVPVTTGTVGQAVAHVALARQCRLHLKGLILNCTQPCTLQQLEEWAPTALIQSLTGVPVLGTVPFLADPTNPNRLAQVASELMLERILPLSFHS
ncbi:dethiobiotin synthase [Leptolyngbya sp. AN02str]|uniref:dethiobiotin synthase n=1 Tax=Leptolyngbya sp. AN02str TaxID=3423363 RepID=UPI003D31E398